MDQRQRGDMLLYDENLLGLEASETDGCGDIRKKTLVCCPYAYVFLIPHRKTENSGKQENMSQFC